MAVLKKRYDWAIRLRRYLNLFSTFLAGLSILSLFQHGFEFGLASAISIILGWYDDLLTVLLSWIEPIIDSALRLLPINLEFQNPNWRSVFVLYAVVATQNYKLVQELAAEGCERIEEYRKSVPTIFLFSILVVFTAGIFPSAEQSPEVLFWLLNLLFFMFAFLLTGFIGKYVPHLAPEHAPETYIAVGRRGIAIAKMFLVAMLLVMASSGLSLLGL